MPLDDKNKKKLLKFKQDFDLPKQKKAYIGLTYIFGIGQKTARD